MSIAAMPHPIEHARQRTVKVRDELKVASAELGLAHDALQHSLPPEVMHGDVAWAIGQNADVERKVQEAAEELHEVTELLHEEEAERKRLERELASRRGRE